MKSLHIPITIDRRLSLAVVAFGATSIVAQVILLRDFLSAFYGNELVIGIILANWMIITGAGSFLGKFSRKLTASDNLIALLLAFAAGTSRHHIVLAALPPEHSISSRKHGWADPDIVTIHSSCSCPSALFPGSRSRCSHKNFRQSTDQI